MEQSKVAWDFLSRLKARGGLRVDSRVGSIMKK